MTKATHRTTTAARGSILLGLAGGLVLVSGGLLAGYALTGGSGAAVASTRGSAASTERAAPLDLETLQTRTIEVVIGQTRVPMRLADLGVIVDVAERAASKRGGAEALAAVGRLPLALDRARAVAALIELKSHHDLAPTDAYLDLEGRTVHADRAGVGVDVLASLPRLALAARTGAPSVELVVVALSAGVTQRELGIDDISTVLGHYTTKFSVADKERNFNLKLAASKLNGFVMQPGAEFSFNAVTGERTEKQGYKVAHVISAGEMVDGLAGGTCQISTTLFAASFFAGIDIVSQRPHSRPSVYAPMALDATVVYPTTDLVMKNSYEFPVVIHYRVAGGEAEVEILGKQRPYDKIVFERTVLEQTPFTSEQRLDDKIIAGQTSLDQAGFDGYRVTRTRKFMRGGDVVKTDRHTLTYRPVTEFVRVGTSLELDGQPASEKQPHSPKAPASTSETISQ